MRLTILAIALATTACVVGAPPGFSSGDQWTFPLVDPLDGGLLVTPVTIKGKGPYLFVIDPEAEVSIIDERIILDAGLVTDRGYTTRAWGDDGVRRVRFNAELRDIQIGTLGIEVRRAIVVPHETLATLGRDIRGVLGRNVIADSLVFGFDRGRGIAWLETAKHFTPPAATRVDFEVATPIQDNRAPELRTRAQLGKTQLTVAIQLGSLASRVRPNLWPAVGLAAADRTFVEIDATGARRDVPISATPARVTLGAAANDRVAIGEYVLKTEIASEEDFVAGTLGLDFFAPYAVTADWDRHALYLAPLADTPAAQRISRWPQLAACAHPGCVTATLAAPASAPPPPADGAVAPPSSVAPTPTFVLHVTRDPGATGPLEVRLHAAARPDLPDFIVEMPADAADVLEPVRGDLAGVHYDVIDASPFATPCPGPGGCARMSPRTL